MADDSTTTTNSSPPAEVAVSDVASHFSAIVQSANAHLTLITSKPNLYPGGLPVALDTMRKQLTFTTQQVQAAMPATPAGASGS